MTINWIKVAGIAASAAGLGVSLVADWVSDKKTDKIIEEKVIEAVAKITKG